MRIALLFISIFLTCASAPVYGIQQENIDKEKEKRSISEKAMHAREERENSLHPFVRDITEGEGSVIGYDIKLSAPAGQENKAPQKTSSMPYSRPDTAVNFVFISIILAGFLLAYFFIR